MNRSKISGFLCLALVFFMSLALIPASLFANAAVEPAWTVPSGYNEHDYNAIASFLEQTNASGKKNGEWLNSAYDPGDPNTWGSHHFTFTTVSGQKRVSEVLVANMNGLVGSLDLSDFTSLTTVHIYSNKISALNVSGCTALFTLYCYDNRLTEIDVSTNSALSYFNCSRNSIGSIDVSNNPNLVIFNCGSNPIGAVDVSSNTSLTTLNVSNTLITSVDVSRNTALKTFYCENNAMKDIDLSNNSQLPIDGVYAVGSGTVGTKLISTASEYYVYAVPDEGQEFLGWYDENGDFVSDIASLRFYSGSVPASKFYAHFTETTVLLGDVDFDGDVDATDALMTMRYAMNIITFTDEQLIAGDVNKDGAVNVTDTVLIMRIILGHR